MASLVPKVGIFVSSILFLILKVIADDDYEGEDELFSNFGEFAFILSLFGGIFIVYSITTRVFWDYIPESRHQLVISIRKKLLLFHKIVMLAATTLALVHAAGYITVVDRLISGLFVLIPMLILTITGIIMSVKFKAIWLNKKYRGIVRAIHLQYVIPIIFYIALFYHYFTA